MIIRTELLQECCSKILSAVDSNVLSQVTETLEIKCHNKVLNLAVTNREYFVDVNLETESEAELHATVNANLFLKLVSKVTSETIEMTVGDSTLNVKCNGDYKLPLIFDGDALMELPRIIIQNEKENFEVQSALLHSIVNYNSKELTKGVISQEIQRLYYLDNQGAITFTAGACINNFECPIQSKLLLTNKLVKLFKLFKDTLVKVSVGENDLGDGVKVTSIMFSAPGITISALLNSDESFQVQYPAENIRQRAKSDYPYTVNINKELFVQAVDRLLPFIVGVYSHSVVEMPVIKVHFSKESVIVSDKEGKNTEEIFYAGSIDTSTEIDYTALVDSSDWIKTLDTCSNQIVTISFGDSAAFRIQENSIYWVVPECHM